MLLKGLGFAGLIALVAVFRSGTPENIGWITTGWWGILGLIGWGYLVAALVYLVSRDSLLKTGLFWLFFIALNVLSQLDLTDFLNPVKPVFGVIISGNTPSIVLAGLFFSLILRKVEKESVKKFLLIATVLGLAVLISGFVLRNWFIISKIKGTPS